MSGRAIVRTTLILLPMQIVFRAGEAILPWLLAVWFGRSHATDIYNLTFFAFTLAASLVFGIFQDSALVPILAEVKRTDRAAIPRITGSILAHTLLFGTALAVVVALLGLGWFSLHYDGDDWLLGARMVPFFGVLLVTMSVKTFFWAVLNADHHYFAQPVASSISIVATIAIMATFRHSLGVLAIPIGTLVGDLLAIAVLAVIAVKFAGMRIHLTLDRPEPVLRFARLVASEVGGSAVTRINPVVDQFMAGLAAVAGGGTLLRFSGDVASLPTSLLQAALLPVLLSHLSEYFAAGDIAKVRATVARALLIVGGLLVGISFLLYLVREPLLKFVFLRGEMDAAGVDRMIRILPYHLVGLAPFGLLLVLARAHVAVKNSGIMLGMGALNAMLNASFNLFFLKVMGLEGLALSTSCVQAVITVVFWFRFEAKIANLRRSVAV